MLRHRPRRIVSGSAAIAFLVGALLLVFWQGGGATALSRTAAAIARDLPLGEMRTVRIPVPNHLGMGRGILVTRISADGEEELVGEVWSYQALSDSEAWATLRVRDGSEAYFGHDTVVQVAFAPRTLSEAAALVVPADHREAFEQGVAEDLGRAFVEEIQPALLDRVKTLLPEIMPPDEEIEAFISTDLVPAVQDAYREPLVEMEDRIIDELNDTLGALDRAGLLWDVASGDYEGVRDRLMPPVTTAIEGYLRAHRSDLVERARTLASGYEEPAINLFLERFAPPIVDRAAIPTFREFYPRLAARIQDRLRDAYLGSIYQGDGRFHPLFVHAFASRALRHLDAKVWIWADEPTGPAVAPGEAIRSRVYFNGAIGTIELLRPPGFSPSTPEAPAAPPAETEGTP